MTDSKKFKPKIIGFMCNWCCYAGADLCGVSRLQYPPYIRIIRIMCSGRMDMRFILKSFDLGADGVFIGGCWPADCHYVTEGNYDALSLVLITKSILKAMDINPERLRLEWVSASEGNRFAEVMNDFAEKIQSLGPLGAADGESIESLSLNLRAASLITPYVRLVERERLRFPGRSQPFIEAFFRAPDTQRLLRELIISKLNQAKLSLILRDGPATKEEITKRLGLDVGSVTKHLGDMITRGLVRFDHGSKAYVLV